MTRKTAEIGGFFVAEIFLRNDEVHLPGWQKALTQAHPERAPEAGTRSRLLHRHTLRQIARLIDIGATQHRDVVGQQLQRYGEQNRGDEFATRRQGD